METLDLSARTLNCLKRAGVHRVGEVLEMPRRDLLKIRNFGQKSLDELYERLEQKGFWSPEGTTEDTETSEEASGEEGQEEIVTVSAGETEDEA